VNRASEFESRLVEIRSRPPASKLILVDAMEQLPRTTRHAGVVGEKISSAARRTPPPDQPFFLSEKNFSSRSPSFRDCIHRRIQKRLASLITSTLVADAGLERPPLYPRASTNRYRRSLPPTNPDRDMADGRPE